MSFKLTDHLKVIRLTVLITGPLLAAIFTLAPVFRYGTGEEIAAELTSGAGIGWLIASLPYFIFYKLANDNNWAVLGAFILMVTSVAGLLLMLLVKDPQTGIAYFLYILPLQYLTVLVLAKGKPTKPPQPRD